MTKPKMKFHQLDSQARLVILSLVRGFCKEMKLYQQGSKKGLNPEKVEETLISLIDDGIVHVKYDKQKDEFWLECQI